MSLFFFCVIIHVLFVKLWTFSRYVLCQSPSAEAILVAKIQKIHNVDINISKRQREILFFYSQNIKKRIKLARFRDYVYFCIYKFRSLPIRMAWPAGLYFLWFCMLTIKILILIWKKKQTISTEECTRRSMFWRRLIKLEICTVKV